MPNAQININVGIQSRRKRAEETWTPTTVGNQTFNYITELDTYLEDTPGIADEVYEKVYDKKEDGWEVTLHFDIRLDNVTHAPTAKGVVPLAKGHRDARMSHLEIVSEDSVEKFINNIVANLKQHARY